MKDQKGFSLIEVVIAVALLGIIAVGFLGALGTASKALLTADERETAKNLAESQMEYVQEQDYSRTNVDWYYTVTDSERNSSDAPDWWVDANPGNPPYLSSNYAWYSVDASADEDELNVGLQVITVKIYHGEVVIGEEVFTLEGYKVDR